MKYHQDDLHEYSFLVTGGAGFIGSNIVEYLLKYNARVRVLDNFSTGLKSNIDQFIGNPRFDLLEGDIRDYKTCKRAMFGIDYVSHQAALGSVPRSIQDPITSNEVNVGGFLNILTAAKEAKIKRMVYAASSSTYGDSEKLPKKEEIIGSPISPYAVTKYVNELYADVYSKTYNFHAIGLRYFNVFGPKQNPAGPYAAVIPLFITKILNGEPPIINGSGENTRDFTFVKNVVQANIKALLAKHIDRHSVMNIAYGQQTSLLQLLSTINDILGTDISPVFGSTRLGDVKHSLADISKARNTINYFPEFDFLSGMRDTICFFKEKHHNS